MMNKVYVFAKRLSKNATEESSLDGVDRTIYSGQAGIRTFTIRYASTDRESRYSRAETRNLESHDLSPLSV